jgi:predicted thioredoxin/glutaredoxin
VSHFIRPLHDAILKLRETTRLTIMENRTKNEIFNLWNDARNTLKHYNEKSNETVTINLFDEAYWIIKRAIVNSSKLGIPISNEEVFENWCIAELNL